MIGRICSYIFVFSLYGFLFIPMIVLLALSFNAAPRGARWEGFTLDWYSKLIDNESILSALVNSIEIAAAACLLSGVIGLAVGIVLARSESKTKAFAQQGSTLPVVLPEVVQGLALLMFLVWLNVPLGKLSVILAHCGFGTAYVAILVKARLANMDSLLEEAASDLGASEARTFMTVTLPQIRPAVVSGMLMVFTLSFDDFIVAFFTAGVGATTLPLKIYSMLKFGISPQVNALSALILVMSLILVSFAFWNNTLKETQGIHQ